MPAEVSPAEAVQEGNTAYKNRIYSRAMTWHRKAADQGDPAAEYDVGLLFAQGRGVEQNLAEARNWMTKAAAGGSEYAKRWLAQH